MDTNKQDALAEKIFLSAGGIFLITWLRQAFLYTVIWEASARNQELVHYREDRHSGYGRVQKP